MVDLNILYLFEMLRKCSAGASNSPSNALKQDGPFDVIIIGAGAAGLAAARLLLKCNKYNPPQKKLPNTKKLHICQEYIKVYQTI